MAKQRQDQPGEASEESQLAQRFLLAGELNKAQDYAERGLAIDKDRGLIRALPGDYHVLAEIARVRGDADQAAEWRAMRDEALAELERRASGQDAGLGAQMLQSIAELSLLCVQTGLAGESLAKKAESTVAWLESAEGGPFQPLGQYLRTLAAGPTQETLAALAAPPSDLPEPFVEIFAELRQAAEKME